MVHMVSLFQITNNTNDPLNLATKRVIKNSPDFSTWVARSWIELGGIGKNRLLGQNIIPAPKVINVLSINRDSFHVSQSYIDGKGSLSSDRIFPLLHSILNGKFFPHFYLWCQSY